jgi:CheY-like chemotaxis protein/HPt (histidine-containing phosphotransfer) domain-containing protein
MDDPDARARAGIDAWLSKPVRQSHLFDALLTVTRARPAVDPGQAPAPEPGFAARHHGRILLVEDNRINQEVARELLGILGAEVRVASNGREALEAARQADFDLILMDCQMPEMDGYEATRVLRRAESNGDRRTPIVAMTAHAMEGDREQCLAAGMDDYLPKPFRVQQLQHILDRWLPCGSTAGAQSARENAPTPEPGPAPAPTGGKPGSPLDSEALENLRVLERHGAEGALGRTIQFYLEDAPPLLREIEAGVGEGDPERVRRAAHSLKSISANVGALGLASLCQSLESAGRAKALADTETLLYGMAAESEAVFAALRAEQGEATHG